MWTYNEVIKPERVICMFDMREIGRKISQLRRNKNMTQVELADLLSISYQAVSNWERGDSMPDISKLSDLSKIFDISIDELLGNTKETKAVQEILAHDKIDLKAHDPETIEAIMPMVKPKQIDESMKNEDNISMEMLLALAPFLDEDKIDEIALEAFHIGASKELSGLAPFMSSEALSKLVMKALDSNESMDHSWYSGLIPFLDEDAIDLLGSQMYKKFGVQELQNLAPFMSEDALSKLAMEASDSDQEIDHQLLQSLLPFLDEDAIDSMAIKVYKNSGVEAIQEFVPFMTENAVEKIVDEEVSKGNYKSIMSLLPFTGEGLSESILKNVRKTFKKE